jgi:hypothetical protein
MTQDEIIEMAKQAGFDVYGKKVAWDDVICTDELVAFAKLVAEKEREACAKIADSQLFNTNALLTAPMQSSAAYQIGVFIRARGQA